MVTDDFVAVIDGSTSKSTVRCHRRYRGGGLLGFFREHSDGEQAMLIVADTVRRMRKEASCHQFCVAATAAVRKYYMTDKLSHLAAHPEDRMAASCIVFSRLRREIWMVGDCQGLLTPLSAAAGNGIFLDNPKPSERELAERRAEIIKSSPQPWGHFLRDDTARKAIIPHMLETMRQQNNGYSVIDGFSVDEAHVKIVTLDLQPWEIVLATDGYPFLCPTLQKSEELLERQRRNDPLNICEFKATKAFNEGSVSFDDRAYIRFTG